MKIFETERLVIREVTADDAAFVVELLNTPKFLKYIADRGVRTLDQARAYIAERFVGSYRNNGFGLYLVELKQPEVSMSTLPIGRVSALVPIGLCGFVRRDALPGPDLGFAFLPEFERQGYGFESASAMMEYGRDTLGFNRVLAITSRDNEGSDRLLIKLGFAFNRLDEIGGEQLNIYSNSTERRTERRNAGTLARKRDSD